MADGSIAGMSRAALDVAESRDFALGPGPKRPRDAGTLILLDRVGAEVRVLMGRRHSRHAFMPGKFVFPGGRTDPDDGRVPVAGNLHAADEARILRAGGRITPTRARAIALSAIRETYEEAGLLIGRHGHFAAPRPGWQAFADHDVYPSLEGLRFVARAITPPGRVRRFDTRFLAAWRSEVAVELPDGPPTDELEELVWVPLGEAPKLDLPRITGDVLSDLRQRIEVDPDMHPGGPIPFYRMLHKHFIRQIL